MSNVVYEYNMKGGADKEAAILREKVLSATDNIKISGKSYYVSHKGNDNNDGLTPETAWRTLDKIVEMGNFLEYGDGVLFERGGEYRLTKPRLELWVDGVTFAAYGEGKKPVLMGSDMNYADPSLWKKTNRDNLWELQLPKHPHPEAKFFDIDPGIMVFDDKMTGILKGAIREIEKDFDFAYHKAFCKVYLYYSGGNPGEIFDSIEIGGKRVIFYGEHYVKDITIDNLCIKNTGEFGIRFVGYNENITITNCEFGWIGGSHMGKGSRYGNAIEFWCDCKDILIQNNWIYQVYDAGITPQGEQGMVCDGFKVIGNLIEYCTYSYELFCYDSIGWYKNGLLKDNIMRFAGYGWGQQRPECSNTGHYTMWTYDLTNSYQNYYVENNIFDCSYGSLICWHWKLENANHDGFNISGNTYYQKSNPRDLALWYGYEKELRDAYLTATNQEELEKAVTKLENEPKLIKWLEN